MFFEEAFGFYCSVCVEAIVSWCYRVPESRMVREYCAGRRL